MEKNIDELKMQLDNAEAPAEEETEEKNTDAVDSEGQDDGSQDEEIEGEDEQGQDAENGEQFVAPDKFKNKSTEDVVKSYLELEKMHTQKMGELQKQIDEMKKNPAGTKKEDKKDDDDTEWEKLSPAQFAKKIIDESKKASKESVQEISQTKSEVTKEITEAKKEYPNLTKNQAYKETVVAIMEAAAAQGKIMKLKDACAKVEALIGEKEKITQTEEKRMKQTKAQIETMGGSPSGNGNDSEEAKIKNGMLRGSGGTLGGLGI